MTASPPTPRERILDATLVCIERWGIAKTSLEDVATEAGLSRATVYRYFPGGRDQLISDTVAWEVRRFFGNLAAEVDGLADLESKLERGLVYGHQAIVDHRLLQQVLSTEPEAFLEELSGATDMVFDALQDYLAGLLAEEALREGVEVATAAEYLARMFLSYIGSQGQWDLTDPDQAVRLVRTQFLAGILA